MKHVEFDNLGNLQLSFSMIEELDKVNLNKLKDRLNRVSKKSERKV